MVMFEFLNCDFAVLYLQPRCHPYTVYKLSSFLQKLIIIHCDAAVLASCISGHAYSTVHLVIRLSCTGLYPENKRLKKNQNWGRCFPAQSEHQ